MRKLLRLSVLLSAVGLHQVVWLPSAQAGWPPSPYETVVSEEELQARREQQLTWLLGGAAVAGGLCLAFRALNTVNRQSMRETRLRTLERFHDDLGEPPSEYFPGLAPDKKP